MNIINLAIPKAEKIIDFKKLLEDGLITEEDFERAKSDILRE